MGLFDFLKVGEYKAKLENLQTDFDKLVKKCNDLGVNEYYQVKDKIDSLTIELKKLEAEQSILLKAIDENSQSKEKLEKNIISSSKKLSKLKEIYKSIDYTIDNFTNTEISYQSLKLPAIDLTELELLSPSVILKLHSMDMKDLRKAYKDNDKSIEKVLSQYLDRYTTKSNRTIYQLMVIALRAELQNILYNLKYEKLDKAIDDLKIVTAKYLKIVAEGNQSIAGTLTKFIGEIEYLFINAVKIEYNYYVKKEQARQEQLSIREQMRQEAEERKALENEKKKIEKEEEKYNNEITKLSEMLSSAKDAELDALNARILELQSQLSNVVIKKEEISNLQNGKAGNVYIISNLGSFGDNVFKIGMTRRLNPQDRVNELGDASVPFKFDVHSFIFSDDAVGLESSLHQHLNDRRVNKVNLRKEFFNVTIDELEHLISEIAPTAEFNRTMIAEEYNQSISSNEVYKTDFIYDEDNDDE